MRLLEIFKKGDMILLALCAVASVFGIVMIYAATYVEGNTRMIVIQTASLFAGIVSGIRMRPAPDISAHYIRPY